MCHEESDEWWMDLIIIIILCRPCAINLLVINCRPFRHRVRPMCGGSGGGGHRGAWWPSSPNRSKSITCSKTAHLEKG